MPMTMKGITPSKNILIDYLDYKKSFGQLQFPKSIDNFDRTSILNKLDIAL